MHGQLNVKCSQDIIGIIKLRLMIWTKHVARMRENIYIYIYIYIYICIFLWRNLKGSNHLEVLAMDGSMILKYFSTYSKHA